MSRTTPLQQLSESFRARQQESRLKKLRNGAAQLDDDARDTADIKPETPRVVFMTEVIATSRSLWEVAKYLLSCVPRVPDSEAAARAKVKQPKLKSILRTGHDAQRSGQRIKWRTVLVGDDTRPEELRGKLQLEAEDRERKQRFDNWMKLARLPALTAEELLIPIRIAFPDLTVDAPLAIVLDVAIDIFEIGWIVKTVREQPTPEQRKILLEESSSDGVKTEVAQEYTAADVARDFGMATSVHIARAIYILSGDNTLWTLVQVLRAMRVKVLITYVQHINNDLSTNVKFLAIYKFGLVMVSIPHWVACIWWALAAIWGPVSTPLPSWPAQFADFSGNPEMDTHLVGSWHHYLMSLYMSWAGLSSMGYGNLMIVSQTEVIFVSAVALIQMVFYAFILGTLLHYLVRTNEATVHFSELMKAVDAYVEVRKLPPELAGKIRAYYSFQHRKQAAGTERIFAQMPLSMRTEVAVAQHDWQVHATWVFWSCTPQFLSYLAIFLRERYMMPNETLFKRGDGASELLWCVRGVLNVSKNDVHITTVRSDLGPGQIVGEIAFFIGIQQPYTVAASSKGEVTLVVLSASSFEEIIGSYPEQTDQITQNVLRKYGLDKKGASLAGGFQEQMDEDELKEFEELRATIRTAICERNEELFAQMDAAVKSGDVETVRMLVARGFDLSLGSYDLRTPLHLAAIEGHRTIVRVLCELGASVQEQDRFGSTPIKDAIDGMHGAVADELAHYGSRLTLARPATRMLSASKAGDMASMTMLVAHGIDISAANYDGRTALHVAAFEGNARVSEYLLTNMADVHKKDRWGRSALDDAIEQDRALVAQMLLRNSARPDAKLMSTLLRDAADQGETDRLRFLLEMGVPVDSKDYDQRTALHYAVRSGSVAAAHLLVCALADIDVLDRWNRPPLLDALEVSPELASILALQCGAQLPSNVAHDAQLGAQLKFALSIDMYELNKEISDWTAANKRGNEQKLDTAREVEMAFALLADDFSTLARTQRSVFRTVERVVEVWVTQYGEEGDSDTDSDVGDAKADELDDDESEDGDALPQGNSFSKRDGKVANQFIKLVLQLPSAETGLTQLRALFASKVDTAAFRALAPLLRRKAEHEALTQLLEVDLGLGSELADEAMADVYAELQTFLGASAPQLPSEFLWLANSLLDSSQGRNGKPQHGRGHQNGNATADTVLAIVTADREPHARDTRSQSSERAVKTAEVLRRGSKTGSNLIDIGRLKDLGLAVRPEDPAERRSSASQRRKGQAAHEAEPEESSRVFLSDLGHVVVLCSRRLVDALAERHAHAGPAQDDASHGDTPRLAPEDEELAPAPSPLRSRLARLSFNPSPAAVAARRSDSTGVELLGAPPKAAGASLLLSSVQKAAHVLLRLFQVFDRRGDGVIHLRDVKRLQGDMGEMGSTEIKSLLSFLMDASNTLGHDGLEPRGFQGAQTEQRRSSFEGRRKSAADLSEPEEGRLKPKRRGASQRLSLSDITLALEVEAAKEAALAEPPALAGAAAAATTALSLDSSVGEIASAEPQQPQEPTQSRVRAPDAGEDAATEDEDEAEEEEEELGLRLKGRDEDDQDPQRRHSRRKRVRTMSESQFFVGVSAWILIASGQDAEAEEAEVEGGGLGVPGLAIPHLSALSLASDQPCTTKKQAAIDKAAQKAEQAARALRDEQLARELDAVLESSAALLLLADNIQLRLDSGRTAVGEAVSGAALMELVQHAVVIPAGASVEMLERWAGHRLELALVNGRRGAGKHPGRLQDDDDAASSKSGGPEERPLLAAGLLGDEGDSKAPKEATWADVLAKLRARGAAHRAESQQLLDVTVVRRGPASRLLQALGLASEEVRVVTSSATQELEGAADEVDRDGASAWPWYVMSVNSKWYGYVHVVFLLLVYWDALFVPMQLCFIFEVQHMAWVSIINSSIDAVYIMRILLRLNTSFIDEKSVEVFRPRAIRQYYLHGDFVLDVFACWPHDLLAMALKVTPLVVYSLRLLRLFNTRYAFAAFARWKSGLADSDFARGLLKNLTPLMLTVHYSACVWNVIGFSPLARSAFGYTWADSYARQRLLVTEGASSGANGTYASWELQMLDHYVISLFFALSLVSALGVAQLPANFFELGAFVFMCLLNTTIYAWCVGGISGLVMKQDDEIVGKRAQLELVHAYVRHIHVPAELKERMTKFFQQRLQFTSLSSVDSEQIYLGLPVPLQVEVAVHTNRSLVGSCALLRGCNSGFLDRLSSALRERELEPETSIFRAGEACKELLLVASGVIETTADGEDPGEEATAEQLGMGDTLGEVSFVFGIRHYKSARVGRNKASVYVLSTDAYRELLKSFPAQEDVVMDNTMHQYEGMATSRSGKSKISAAASSQHGGSNRDGQSDAGKSNATNLTNLTGANLLLRILSDAKRKREDVVHTQLCTACAKGDHDKVRGMLHARAINLEYGDFAGRSALHLAAAGGDERIIELLISQRANVNIEDKQGSTPLADALRSEKAGAAALLIRYGGRHGSRDESDEVCSAAAEAAGTAEMARLCQSAGNASAANQEGRTPLHVAAAEGCLANAQILIDAKADVNALDRRGATPLHDAIVNRRDATCELLLAHGAGLGDFDASFHLNMAAAANDVTHLARLLRFKCAINSTDKLGRTPLHLAAASRNLNALSFLLDSAGIDVDAEDSFGNTPYDDSLREDSPEQRVLVALFASRNARKGSHVRHLSAASGLKGEQQRERSKKVAAVIDDRRGMLRKVRALSKWIGDEREAARTFKGQMDKAIAIERERGAVLADEHPEVWEQVYAYAEGYIDWREDARFHVLPLIDGWQKQTREFAGSTALKLQTKLNEVLALAEIDAKPVERLNEVTFRKAMMADGS